MNSPAVISATHDPAPAAADVRLDLPAAAPSAFDVSETRIAGLDRIRRVQGHYRRLDARERQTSDPQHRTAAITGAAKAGRHDETL